MLAEFKRCRKKLHLYPLNHKRCPECAKEYRKQYRNKHLEERREASRKWREKNLARASENLKKWKKANKAHVNNLNSKRRAIQKEAMPPWADEKAIKAVYEECNKLTQDTGIKHEVDHIYPLQSKYLCGLHVETNLQILTKSENAAKNNLTWPGQLDCQKD
jgi:hypothetical protein